LETLEIAADLILTMPEEERKELYDIFFEKEHKFKGEVK
jgi:protein-tyrosine-phosphatase